MSVLSAFEDLLAAAARVLQALEDRLRAEASEPPAPREKARRLEDDAPPRPARVPETEPPRMAPAPAKPVDRSAQRSALKAYWAALTPAERAERVRKMHAGLPGRARKQKASREAPPASASKDS